MIIDTNLAPFTVSSSDSLRTALEKISSNKSHFVVCLSESLAFEGVLTDGDFRRWAAQTKAIDLDTQVSAVCNRSAMTMTVDTPSEKIAARLSDRIAFIPLVDATGRVHAVARQGGGDMHMGDRILASSGPTFVIAEIGINHNGSMEIAKRLIDASAEAGADCAKFQMRHMSALYSNKGNANDASEDLGAQYTLDMLARSTLTDEEMLECFDYTRGRGLVPMCSPWDLESVAVLAAYGIESYKIASADLTNHNLLRAVAATGKPIVVSTGMSSESEILESVALLRQLGAQFVLLHCNSTYPAPFKDVNLAYLDRLRDVGGGIAGYSGHERGYSIPVAAVGRGAKVIEKHITLDRTMLGNDHRVSLEPDEFKAMVKAIRQVDEALGDGSARQISTGERMNREVLAKSIVASCSIKQGAIIDDGMLDVKSPGKGIQPNRMRDLVGRTAKRDMIAGDFFYDNDLVDEIVKPRAYKFRRPWGIPVRYHDWQQLYAGLPMDFLEFHFSFKDLEIDPKTRFGEVLDTGLVVHSPDLFTGDHILNLAADDEDYRRISIANLQRAIDVARSMKPWFSRGDRIPLVVSLGGFSRNAPLPLEARSMLYDRVAESLSHLDTDGVEILPQTLPPFPWYLGGQLFCNLFVDPEDTAQFCKDTGLRACFDISHSKLACNHRKRNFSEFVEIIGPHAGHLHIVDAAGVDGEGLQIGEGEVDFADLAARLDRLCPKASFIPEIWQGHKNGGEGFWIALEKLEGQF